MATRARRIAAVDIGTNSIHMIIAELRKRGYRVVDKEKQMVQLGLGSLDGAPLTNDAIDRATSALTKMAAVARGWEVDEIVAVDTSAVRDAQTRHDFIGRVIISSGVRVRLHCSKE